MKGFIELHDYNQKPFLLSVSGIVEVRECFVSTVVCGQRCVESYEDIIRLIKESSGEND